MLERPRFNAHPLRCDGDSTMSDASEDLDHQIRVVLAAIREAPDDVAREKILYDFYWHARQSMTDEIVRKMRGEHAA